MKLADARDQMGAALNAVAAFADKGIVARIERKSGTDAQIRELVDTDLMTRGLSIIVQAASGAVKSSTIRGVSLNALVAVVIYENPTVSSSGTGCGISSEDAIEYVIRAVCGVEVAGGFISVAEGAWLREPQEDGCVLNAVGFMVPVSIRA